MKKHYLIIAVLVFSACTPPVNKQNTPATSVADITADSLLIIPGQRVGNITLGEDMQTLPKTLGEPDQSDAGMGGAVYTWFAKHDTSAYRTDVYGHRNMGMADENILHIKKILITNPAYKTADGISTGLPTDSIKKNYTLSDSSMLNVKHQTKAYYIDVEKGIAFEIDPVTRKCTAISVFAPNDSASAKINTY